MRSLALASILSACVGLGFLPVGAAQQAKPEGHEEAVSVYQCPMHPEVQATWQAKCPICGMTMQKIGTMPAGSTLKQETIGTSRLQSGDPAALLARRQDLKLTDRQVAELGAIAKEAEGKGLAVLSGDQKAALKTLSGASEPTPQARPR